MTRVTFLQNGVAKPYDVNLDDMPYQRHGRRGSLLDVALNVGFPLEHACGGNAACTTCHVIVREGMDHLSEMDDEEADRLDGAWGVTPRSRLACQAIVKGDVTCEIP